MNDQRPLSIYIIAGEASGDLLGAHLMRALKNQSAGPIKFSGVGGDKMTAEGLHSLFPYEALSLMGFVEILPHMFQLTAKINSTVEDILAKQPDVVVTIDSPGFCFRVVQKLRKAGIKSKCIHYVAPTVWAYKPERAEKCAKLFDHMLALLPFEPPYFEKAGLACTFVGHPVVAETQSGNGDAFREKYGIAADTTLFSLLPGSRKGEVSRHVPIFAKTIAMLATQYPNLAMAVAVPKQVMQHAAPYFANCPFRTVVTSNEQDKKDAISASDFALVKSGTVALEVAMAGTPMLVAYRVHPISAWLLKRMMISRFVNLVNILRQKEAIPELIQDLCTPLLLANAAASLLGDADRRARQLQDMHAALNALLPPEGVPSALAAAVVLQQPRAN